MHPAIRLPRVPWAGLRWAVEAIPAYHLPSHWGAEACAPASARQAQFWAGRSAAAQVLGSAAEPLPKAAHGGPQWPVGWVGSISHTQHLAIAAGMPANTGGLGVDIEPALALPADAARVVLTAGELGWLAAAPPWCSRAVFGLKECLHKAVNPGTGVWLEFDEVAVQRGAGDAWQLLALSAAAHRLLHGAQLRLWAGLWQGQIISLLRWSPP